MDKRLFLVEPSIKYKKSFQEMAMDFKFHGEKLNAGLYKAALENFEQYIKTLQNHSKGIELPEGWVPGYSYWLTDDTEEIYGVVRIRPKLISPEMELIGGNIGYDVPPKTPQKRIWYHFTGACIGESQVSRPQTPSCNMLF